MSEQAISTATTQAPAVDQRRSASCRQNALVLAVLVGGLALRATTLNGTFAEVHGWRQADVAMIAGNFYRGGFDIFHPRVDWAGTAPGYVGTEFPLVPALAALLYAVFGEHLVIGRLISLVFFLAGAFFFYLLVRKYLGYGPALWAVFLYVCSPLMMYYSRAFMPDSAMLFFSLGAVWLFDRWLETGNGLAYVSALLFAALALLVKIPAAIIAFPIGYLTWNRWGWTSFRRPGLWVFAALTLMPSVIWYTHALSLARANYPFHMFGEDGWIWSSRMTSVLDLGFLQPIMVTMGLSVLPPPAIAFVALGAAIAPRRGITRLFHVWGFGFLLFLVLALAGSRHEYYHLPFVPPAAALAGWAIWDLMSHGRGRRVAKSGPARFGVALALAGMVLVSYLGVMLRMQSQTNLVLHEAGRLARATLPPGSLIVAADWGNPVLIQASGLRGWHFPSGERFRSPAAWTPQALETLRRQGAQFFVAPRRPRDAQRPATLLQAAAARLDPPRPLTYLEDVRELSSYLASRYRGFVDGDAVIIYDLRHPRER